MKVFWYVITLLILFLVLIFSKTRAEADEESIFPEKYYPMPAPNHFPEAGTLCWRTNDTAGHRCQVGNLGDIESNIGTDWRFPFDTNNLPPTTDRNPFRKGRPIPWEERSEE